MWPVASERPTEAKVHCIEMLFEGSKGRREREKRKGTRFTIGTEGAELGGVSHYLYLA